MLGCSLAKARQSRDCLQAMRSASLRAATSAGYAPAFAAAMLLGAAAMLQSASNLLRDGSAGWLLRQPWRRPDRGRRPLTLREDSPPAGSRRGRPPRRRDADHQLGQSHRRRGTSGVRSVGRLAGVARRLPQSPRAERNAAKSECRHPRASDAASRTPAMHSKRQRPQSMPKGERSGIS